MFTLLPRAQFEELVVEALATLPPYFQEKISNVEILVETWPSVEAMRRAGLPPGHTLLGLYHGVPRTRRTHAYGLVPPDTITLYQGPIERKAAGDYAKIRQQVRHTVVHELAHHFGISDERLRELGAY